MENKEIVGPGKFVKYAYRLYSYLDGQLLFETPKDALMNLYTVSATMWCPAL